ncbi:MAG: tetratricopeptide repeat protein [Anaerolineaceae bacterium]|nr:tetratricopeptide repeat protein [Anaerolineaceae bacterium]
MTAVLEIRLFGGVSVTLNNTPITGFISNKVLALLVYLAVTRRSHQREALAALLWGEMPDADAKNNLRQALANLRKLVNDHLIIARDAVFFDLSTPYQLDTHDFETILHASRSQPADGRFPRLQDAISLYQGDFLAGFFVRGAPDFEEWMLAQRVRYRELALHTLHSLAEHHLNRGEYGRAIDAATRLLALDAWREEAHRQLMLALARSGQRRAALAQYETCRHLLEQELGVSPSPETIVLYERIRDARHRVHLPSPTTPFVGRAAEMAQITRLLADPTCHLLTLSGEGGSGKTRLALEAAVRVANTFLHGVCFVSLAAVNSLEVVPSTIAEALAAALSGTADPHQQLFAHLHDKELLLILDNLEHLPAADEWVSRLIQACPYVRLLVTSRERLNLHGERLLELDGLDMPPAAPGASIAQYSAVQLFLNSARAAQSDFALHAGNQTAVTRICQLVNGLPLAIELAAAWVRHLTCEEIAHEIAQNLSFLATTQKNVPARHRSLQAAFEHSWALLTEEERMTFARLSVFRGGCTREAATAVTQADLPMLAALCDKSLLRRDVNGRYTIHELLRQYAADKLQADPQHAAATQARHCHTFINFVAGREDALNDARQQQARQEIAAEIDNIRTAWEWAISRQRPDLLDPALESLRVFFEHASWFNEAVEIFGTAATVAQTCFGDDSPLYARLLARQAWFYHRLNRFAEAQAVIEQCLPIFRTVQLPSPAEEAICLQCLANMARAVGGFQQAIDYSQQCLALHRQTNNQNHIAASLNSLAVSHAELGQFEAAYILHEESLAIRRQLGDRRGIATTLVNLGFAAIGQGNYVAMKGFAQEALVIFREIDYPLGEAVATNNLAVACYVLEEYTEARELLKDCLHLCRELGHRHVAAHALGTLGGVLGALGDYREAWQHIRESLQMARDIGSVSATLFGLLSAAVLLSRQGEKEQAAEVTALVYHHASTNYETRDRASHLLEQLATALPAPVMAAAQARGQTARSEEVVVAILQQISGYLET